MTQTISLRTGATMPQIGFGTFQIPDEDTQQAVETALEIGYRSIDTASIYGNEAGVGRALAATGVVRADLFITTKLWVSDMGSASPLTAIDVSLDKLGLDTVDAYLLHWPAPETEAYLEAWTALEQIAATGKARAIGVSNMMPEHLERIVGLGGTVPALNQIELHPAFAQTETVAANEALGIVTEAWSPLAQGAVLADPTVVSIARAHAVTPAQVVLRWHLQAGRVIIPKSVTPARIRENLDLDGFILTAAELSAVDALDRADGRTGPHPGTFNG